MYKKFNKRIGANEKIRRKYKMKEIYIKNVKINYNSKNVRIVDSYKIQKRCDMAIILRLFKIKTGYRSKRSLKSWIREWKSHNRLYKMELFRSHTKDCDLEEHEKIHRLFVYNLLGRF